MPKRDISPKKLHGLMQIGLCLDVRSPAEYREGHIPGAVSMPLLSDTERAQTGITYKQKGRDAAVQQALIWVGPKMSGFVDQARRLSAGRPILLYCWRGGMRSHSMAWLLEQAGLEVSVLEGGYRNWRRYIYEVMANWGQWVVIGGPTGSGKTKLLHALKEAGEQVLDLEALANHRGSAFGALGLPPQPGNEQFISEIGMMMCGMKQRGRIWVEDESSMIGSLHLPEVIVGRLASSPFVYLKTHSERRIHELVHEYGQQARAELEGAFRKIARKIGGQYLNLALEALNAGRLDEAAAIALRYYDKAYAQSLSIRHPEGGMPLSWGANEEVDQVVNRLLGIIKSKQIIPINK
ncbi:MAG: tRNA 2-selenouridine(34) synthase MnmH [Bacteroidota bacterium]